ncbi:hypothetical protein HAX54_004849 [Datura stramonium]|uniref:Uncharacterized protein n=1 Tax=Datura stramonium TaxID=4076 RepID=A0ABS8WT41_DATST|nr:hypothetical protein [Datura stramonium]
MVHQYRMLVSLGFGLKRDKLCIIVIDFGVSLELSSGVFLLQLYHLHGRRTPREFIEIDIDTVLLTRLTHELPAMLGEHPTIPVDLTILVPNAEVRISTENQAPPWVSTITIISSRCVVDIGTMESANQMLTTLVEAQQMRVLETHLKLVEERLNIFLD